MGLGVSRRVALDSGFGEGCDSDFGSEEDLTMVGGSIVGVPTTVHWPVMFVCFVV